MAVTERLTVILRTLGPPQNRALIQSSGKRLSYRLMWRCGCCLETSTLESPGINDRDRDGDGELRWDTCAEHQS